MDALTELQQLGFELPSPTYIFGAIVFGLIGFAAFRYGRKNERKPTLWLGVALMLYPYLISNTTLLYVVGIALCVATWSTRN